MLQVKVATGRTVIHEFTSKDLETARKEMENYLTKPSAATGAGMSTTPFESTVLEADKPFVAVYQAASTTTTSRAATLQYFDTKSKQFRTDFYLEKDHIQKVEELLKTDDGYNEVLKRIDAMIQQHIGRPEAMDSTKTDKTRKILPFKFNGEGLHPEEIKMAFIRMEQLKLPIHPSTQSLTPFDRKNITDKDRKKVQGRIDANKIPGEEFTEEKAKEIKDDLENVITHLSVRP